jgi:hypothetical protein
MKMLNILQERDNDFFQKQIKIFFLRYIMCGNIFWKR